MDDISVLSILPKDFCASLLWRNWWPSEEVGQHNITADWCYIDDYLKDVEPKIISGKYNIIITPRFIFREQWMIKRFISLLSKYNITWIYELDDDLLSTSIIDRSVSFKLAQRIHSELPPTEREAYLTAGYEFQRQMHQQQLGYVDGVTVSTKPLAKVIANYTDAPIHVVPNTMNQDWFRARLDNQPRYIPPITIGWAGGWRYDSDLRILSDAWAELAVRFPQVTFVLYGYVSPSIVKVVPAGRLRWIEWSTLDEYPALLKNIDIGCCSLDDNKWNTNKSPIKWYEMTMAGATCVASPTVYGAEITDGYDGLLANTTDQWIEQLSKLVMDATLRKTIHDNAVETITTKYNIKNTWQLWVSAWDNIRIKSGERHNEKIIVS